jgi:hypothetical protein
MATRDQAASLLAGSNQEAALALLGIVHPRPAREPGGGKPKLRNLVLHGRPSGTPILHRVPILRRRRRRIPVTPSAGLRTVA